MPEFQMSLGDEDKFQRARNLYMMDGPDYPATDIPLGRLEEVDKLLESIDSPKAQETRGWANVERLFHYPEEEDTDSRTEILSTVRASFGSAYDMYGELNYGFRQARLQVIAGSLGLYDCWTAGYGIDDQTRRSTLEAWAEAGRALIKSEGVQLEQQIQVRTELVLLMARLAVRGDTRKPIGNFAVPATLRQRIGHLPRGIEPKYGRYNWDVSLVSYDAPNTAWELKGGIRVDHEYEQNELYPLQKDVMLLGSDELLGAGGLHPINRTLQLLQEVTAPRGGVRPGKEQRNQVVALDRKLDQRIRDHDFVDFASGKDVGS